MLWHSEPLSAYTGTRRTLWSNISFHVKYRVLMLSYQPWASKQGHQKTSCDLQLNMAVILKVAAAMAVMAWLHHIVEVVKAFFFCLILLRSTRLLQLRRYGISGGPQEIHSMESWWTIYEKDWWGWWLMDITTSLQQSERMNAMLEHITTCSVQNAGTWC